MKSLTNILLILIISTLTINAQTIGLQIDEGFGIFPIDSCSFNIQCDIVTLDSSQNSIWQIGKPLKSFFDSSGQSDGAICTDTVNVYPPNNNSFFELKIKNFAPYPFDVILNFRHKIQTSSSDGGYIEVSYDDKISWRNIATDTSDFEILNFENMYDKNDLLANGEPGFSGTSDWTLSRIQWIWALPAKNIWPDSFYVRFNFFSDTISDSLAGWIIDDVSTAFADFGTGINEIAGRPNHVFYPNPSRDVVMYNGGKILSDIKIYDGRGKLVEVVYGPSQTIDISHLRSGIYFLRSDDLSQKVVKH